MPPYACPESIADLNPIGFIYRHLAGGPSDGLYAHYELIEGLGKGSFSTIMKALHKETARWFAVKMLKRRSSALTSHLYGFLQSTLSDGIVSHKVESLKRLAHPNLCQLKEVFWSKASIGKKFYSQMFR